MTCPVGCGLSQAMKNKAKIGGFWTFLLYLPPHGRHEGNGLAPVILKDI